MSAAHRPSDLLRIELDTLWALDARGRLERVRPTDPRSVPPLLAVAAGDDGVVWACSTVVPEALAARIGDLVRDPGQPPAVGWAPGAATALLDLLREVAPIGDVEPGPSYVATGDPPALACPSDVELRSSADTGLAELSGRMAERDLPLTPPWVVAVVGDRVASVCEAARATPEAVEAGVWTYEDHRRLGLASVVTAAWITAATGRTAFYSTSAENEASQGVARRLGLVPLGQWWVVHAA